MTPIKSLRIVFLLILLTVVLSSVDCHGLGAGLFKRSSSIVGQQFIIFGIQTEMKIPLMS